MRDRVTLVFGRREYALLPAFGVQSDFEDRCGSLTAHLINLVSGTATLKTRATLLYFGTRYALVADGQATSALTVQSVMEAMWDEGSGDNDLLLKEHEFIERLLYTPEQYKAKKEDRERTEAAMKAMDLFQTASPDFSASLQPSSDGSLESFGEQPRESSSPA